MRPARRRLLIGVPLALAALLLAATWPLLRLFWLAPTISKDYLVELTKASSGRPDSERAWPIYVRAAEALGPPPADQGLTDVMFGDGMASYGYPMGPEHPLWEDAKAYMEERAEALTLIREGASRPVIGVPLSAAMPRDLELAHWARIGEPAPPPDPQAPELPLMTIENPILGDLRMFARHLALDATIAAADGDAPRAVADIVAITSLARHTREIPRILDDLVGATILSKAANTARHILEEWPDLFEETHLAERQRAFAAHDDTTLRFRSEGERLAFDDLLQRIFSDDGAGNGHMTAAGVRTFRASCTRHDDPDPAASVDQAPAALAYAFIAYTHPDRRDVRDRFSSIMDVADSEAAKPAWKADIHRADRLADAAQTERRNLVLGAHTPPTHIPIQTHQIARHTRDGVIAALALHRHRLATGHWPASLDELVPDYLTSVPLDMFSGEPLRYLPPATPDEPPLLYSVGSDKDDDGGRRVHTVKNPSGGDASLYATGTYDADWIFLGPLGTPVSTPNPSRAADQP